MYPASRLVLNCPASESVPTSMCRLDAISHTFVIGFFLSPEPSGYRLLTHDLDKFFVAMLHGRFRSLEGSARSAIRWSVGIGSVGRYGQWFSSPFRPGHPQLFVVEACSHRPSRTFSFVFVMTTCAGSKRLKGLGPCALM